MATNCSAKSTWAGFQTGTRLLQAILVVMCLAFTSTDAAGYYTDGWDSVLSNNTVLRNGTLLDKSRTEALTELADAKRSFLFDLHALHTSELICADLFSIPLIVTGICVAYNVPSIGTAALEVTLDELLAALRGTSVLVTAGGVNIDLSTLTIQLSSQSFPRAIEATAAKTGGNANLTSGLAAAIAANPRVVQQATDAAALAAVKSTVNSIGFTWNIAAVAANLQCVAIKVTHPLTGLTVAVQPSAGAAGTVMKTDRSVTPVVVWQTSATEAAYPLVELGTLIVSRSYAATVDRDEWIQVLRGIIGSSGRFGNLGMSLLPSFDLNQLIAGVLQEVVSNVVVVNSKGSSSVGDMVTTWAQRYLVEAPVFFWYTGGGSGGGLRAIKGDTHLVAGSESRFSETEYTDYPTVQFVPATALAVSIMFNLPGSKTLTLPRCAAVGIFVGAIKYWDDPLIRQYNPTTRLPNERITVVVRSTKSGTTGIFTEGLNLMDQTCNNGQPRINATSTWGDNTFTGFDNLQTRTGLSGVIALVQATPYSIGYGSAGAIRTAGGLEAVIADEATGAVTAPTAAAVQSSFERANVDPARLTVLFEPDPNAYPFIGVTYWVMRSSRSGNGTSMRSALRFMEWGYTSPQASSAQLTLDLVPLPASIIAQARTKLNAATADGELLIGIKPVEPEDNSLSGGAIAGIVIGAVVFLVLVVVLMKFLTGPNNRFAPTDATMPVSMIFTDIESSTALWAEAPEDMGQVLDDHNDIIRAAIKRHKCYEVKVIGDAFMIACENPRKAVALSLDIQESLFSHEWPDEISELYLDFHEAKGWAVASSEVSRKWWNGVRVRIGIATGFVDIKQDETSQRYDYFGSTVNMAARIEAAGHGGQIVVDESTLLGAEGVIRATESKSKELGAVPLRGIAEPKVLTEIVPDGLKGRVFNDLRIGANAKLEETDSDTTGSIANSDAQSAFSMNSARSDSKSAGPVFEVTVNPLEFLETILAPFKSKEREKLLKTYAESWRIDLGHGSFKPRKTMTSICAAAGKATIAKKKVARERERSGSVSSRNTAKSGGRKSAYEIDPSTDSTGNREA